MRRCSRFICRTSVVFKNRSSLTCTYDFSRVREIWFQSNFFRKCWLPPRSPRFEYSNRLGIIAKPTNSAIHASMDLRLMAACHYWRPPPLLCEQVTTSAALYLYIASVYQCSNNWWRCTIIHHGCKYLYNWSFTKKDFQNFKIFLNKILEKVPISYSLFVY